MAIGQLDNELWKLIEPLLPVRKRRFRHPGRKAGRLLLSSLSFASPSHDHMPARIHDSRCDGPLSAAPAQRLPAVGNLLPVGDFPCTVGVANRDER